jgi:MFS family permease
MLYGGIVFHGICYDFFFITGQIYTNERAGERFRSSAQGMITLATYGVGMLIGFWIAGVIANSYTEAQGHLWRNIWIFPAAIALGVLILFTLLFKRKQIQVVDEGGKELVPQVPTEYV